MGNFCRIFVAVRSAGYFGFNEYSIRRTRARKEIYFLLKDFSFHYVLVGDLLREDVTFPISPYRDFTLESVQRSALLPARPVFRTRHSLAYSRLARVMECLIYPYACL
jgi:hypothetical protein